MARRVAGIQFLGVRAGWRLEASPGTLLSLPMGERVLGPTRNSRAQNFLKKVLDESDRQE
jgi:hypothetical protein